MGRDGKEGCMMADPTFPDLGPTQEEHREGQSNGKEPNGEDRLDRELAAALSVHTWCDLDLPPQVRLIGDVVTDTSRVFLVGPTGIGKSLLGYAIAGSVAAGRSLMHWHCNRPARVLVIDGEMSARMIRRRSRLVRKLTKNIPPDSLMIYALQRGEEFAARFPQLGKPAPLNTEAGRQWLLRLIALTQPDLIIFDSVMSLLSGVMKEEETWSLTNQLVRDVTAMGKSQIWIDHTGWNSDHQYGTATKGWFFDAIGLLQAPQDTQHGEHETVFDICFDTPRGKVRNRDPDNWADFAPHRLRLTGEGWTSEPIEEDTPRPLPRLQRQVLETTINLIAGHGSPLPSGPDFPTNMHGIREDDVLTECEARSLSAAGKTQNRRQNYKQAMIALQAARKIGMRNGWIWTI